MGMKKADIYTGAPVKKTFIFNMQFVSHFCVDFMQQKQVADLSNVIQYWGVRIIYIPLHISPYIWRTVDNKI